MVYLISHAFERGTRWGIRSFSGALLPLIIMTFIYLFNRDLLTILGKVDVLLSYLASLAWGVAVMAVVRVFGNLLPGPVPISEVVLSGSFAVLVLSYVESAQKEVLSYYYGMISGFLLYIILFGFPL